MSEENTKEEDKLGFLKAKVHESLVASLSFAEVVQIMNNMLVQEAEERVKAMSEEEVQQALSEIEAAEAKAKEEAEKEEVKNEE